MVVAMESDDVFVEYFLGGVPFQRCLSPLVWVSVLQTFE